MKKFKNLTLVVLIGFVFVFMGACNKSSEIERSSDVIEFMYEQVLPIISPEWHEPTGLGLFHNAYGGQNLPLTKISENKWTALARLEYTRVQYELSLIDMRVVKSYTPIARKIYVRIQGQSEWIELTHIVLNCYGAGEQAEFILDVAGIHANF